MPRNRCIVLSVVISVFVLSSRAEAQFFSDDFERADGAPTGWTAAAGDWRLEGGELIGGPPPAEQAIFADDLQLPESFRLSFDIRWLAPDPPGAIGRHAGVMFNFDRVAGRGGGSGYLVWWIDRASDKGLNLTRRDAGGFNHLVTGDGAGVAPDDPPTRWTIEVIGPRIRVYGDGALFIEHADSTYRGGRLAFWTWNGEGQVVAYDNVVVEGIVFADDFSRGPVGGWTVFGRDTWAISENETLVGGPSSGGGAAGELQIFAGDPLVELPDDYTLSVDWTALAPTADTPPIGRHFSVFVNFNEPGVRWSPTTTGYQVHWIDRPADRGLNLLRWDGGGIVALQAGTGDAITDPPGNLRVEVEGENIRVYGDDVLYIDVQDGTYRGGIAGAWLWDGAGQQVEFDNFTITDGGGNVVFEDGFAPRPPSLGDWTPNNGAWQVVDGADPRMRGGPPPGVEQEIFANALLPDDFTATVDMSWIAPDPPGGVGRHAGVMFAFDEVTDRGSGSGYLVWWIDRASDRGWNLTRRDNGAFTKLVDGTAPAGANPGQLTVDVAGDTIRVFNDGDMVIEHVDDTYRGGRFALWTWSGEGQTVDYDNVLILGTPVKVRACFELTTAQPLLEGEAVGFDAGCTFGVADTFDWDFGDGTVGSGAVVEHTYAQSGDYTVTLTASGPGGSDTATQDITIVAVVPYDCQGILASDDFGDGSLDDWTVNAGTWEEIDGYLVGGPSEAGGAGAEQQIFLGNPAVDLPANVVIEFDWEYLSAGNVPGVGRHAGLYFCWTGEGVRWAGNTRGYQLWWIDRGSDFGLNLAIWNPGLGARPVAGTFDLFSEPPRNIRLEIDGDRIRCFGDDILAFDVVDTTFRGGKLAFWTWEQGQNVKFDNLCIDASPQACFDIVTPGPFAAGSSIGFDASCSFIPGAGEPTYTWDFGDGAMGDGETVEHAYADAGTYTVTLTLEAAGDVQTTSRDVTVSPGTLEFADDFERADGAVDGWTIGTGDTWALQDGALVAGPTTVEHFIWAGDPALLTAPNVTFEFDMIWRTNGSVAAIGRHAGFQFHFNEPTNRSTATATGYFVDWIDRASDRGVRLSRRDPGAFVEYGGQGAGATADPPTHWKVVVRGDRIQVFVDDADEPIHDVVDGTYRGGYFGFWTWVGDQEVTIDNFTVTADPLTPCCEVSSGSAFNFAGEPLTFDGSCSSIFGGGTITAYDWDFGDGTTGSGVSVDHTYAVPDTYVVTLTITDDSGNTASIEKTVDVAQELIPFADDFERARGVLDGWTLIPPESVLIANGRANLNSTTGAPDAEVWMWPGDPAKPTGARDFAIDFEVPSALFTGNPADGVRRHFGIMVSTAVTNNRTSPESSGYGLWWIDREGDFGINLTRLDGTARTFLALGAGGEGLTDPPTAWRVEFEGPNIRVFGDGVLYIDVEDDTYRGGYVGFWVWKNMSVQFDNVRVCTLDCPQLEGGLQLPGDCNQDGDLNISDASCILNALFLGVGEFPCGDGTPGHPANKAVLNVNGETVDVNLSQAIYILNFLFLGGPPPANGPDDGSCLRVPECPDACVE